MGFTKEQRQNFTPEESKKYVNRVYNDEHFIGGIGGFDHVFVFVFDRTTTIETGLGLIDKLKKRCDWLELAKHPQLYPKDRRGYFRNFHRYVDEKLHVYSFIRAPKCYSLRKYGFKSDVPYAWKWIAPRAQVFKPVLPCKEHDEFLLEPDEMFIPQERWDWLRDTVETEMQQRKHPEARDYREDYTGTDDPKIIKFHALEKKHLRPAKVWQNGWYEECFA